jgi:biotin carboxyl carrier protein
VVELAAMILWFNPVIYFLKRELRLQHEFLADRSVLNHGVSFEHYAQCLIRNIDPQMSYTVISPIGSTSIKNRILMMTRKETSRYLLILYFVMIPAAAFLLMAFGRKSATDQSTSQLSLAIVVEQTPDIPPVDLSKVTNVVKYGDRIHPATQKLTKHTGVDFALALGSDVVSTSDGEVATQQYGDKEGNYVVIRHDETFETRYYHLQKASVKVGDKVKKGQVIGLVGSSGILSSGPHLHYEVVKNGTAVDPKDYLPALTGF